MVAKCSPTSFAEQHVFRRTVACGHLRRPWHDAQRSFPYRHGSSVRGASSSQATTPSNGCLRARPFSRLSCLAAPNIARRFRSLAPIKQVTVASNGCLRARRFSRRGACWQTTMASNGCLRARLFSWPFVYRHPISHALSYFKQATVARNGC